MQDFFNGTSHILSNIASQESLPFVITALIVFNILLLMLAWYQHRRLNKVLRGKNTMTIEESIIEMAKELDKLTDFKEDSQKYFELVEKRLRRANQSIETRRFNAFKGTGAGGNQSFACAFINENGDGLILSSLYASDRMSVFAKPVSKFVSTFELTEEESHALETAKESVGN